MNALPRMIISLRPQDPVPEWMTHLLFLQKDCKIALQGEKTKVYRRLRSILNGKQKKKKNVEDIRKEYEAHANEIGQVLTLNGVHRLNDWTPLTGSHQVSKDQGYAKEEEESKLAEALVEMNGIRVAYGSKTVLGAFSTRISNELKPGLHMAIRRGSRWGIFGSNGSGKTTLLSLLTSDHPQTYALPITHFSRPRLHTRGSEPPLSLFDLQRRIGHSSPEIHAFFPRHLSVRKTLESAFAETFRGRPQLNHERDLDVDSLLRWFEPELNPDFDHATSNPTRYRRDTGYARQTPSAKPATDWADSVILGSLPLSSQRVALFLRALIKKPDLLILDEALSGMDDFVRDKCLLFLQEGEGMAIHVVFGKKQDDQKGKQGERRIGKSRTAYRVIHDGMRFHGLTEQQALVVVSHVKEEVPGMVREWICLPDAEGVGLEKGDGDVEGGGVVRMGRLAAGLDVDPDGWDYIWGAKTPPAADDAHPEASDESPQA
jgi:ABC-type molybdenum transport system ATPase subunit/photorepair protein PhrA